MAKMSGSNTYKWYKGNSTELTYKGNCWLRNMKLRYEAKATDPIVQEIAASRNINPKYETLNIEFKDNITTIIMTRPAKKNAFNVEMYKEMILALDAAAKDKSVLSVLTGSGDYFSSGNDLTNRARLLNREEEKSHFLILRTLIDRFIAFPKPLIAVINGPAIGIAVTILGLFDLVYATDRATEMLVFNKMVTAREACDLGLVTEVFPDKTFKQEVWAKLKAYALLPKDTLTLSKQLIRGMNKEKLHATCKREFDLFSENASSEESYVRLRFFQKKAKL
ncbi:enoyl-CoA delta isomerase 2 [Bombina bombina]|uniref:enoyl-CoA delta isomerase 2 n=1 Tax=Bombina bombina TaxID=8345 RepID=UPI00235A8126|nr:enoyl-CoA delta isomerase 2 [Bombina bombina]